MAQDEYVILNRKNNTYHKSDCEYVQLIHDAQKIKKPSRLSIKYKPASCCYPELVKKIKNKNPNIIEKAREKHLLKAMQENEISLFFVNPVNKKQPQNACINDVCHSLVTLIDNSKQTIDVAAYDFQGQDEIINALRRAKARGAVIRGVCDDNTYKFYLDTRKIENEFGFKEDIFVSIAQRKFDTPSSIFKTQYRILKYIFYPNQKKFAQSKLMKQTV